jgi:hypothetical protein
MSDEGLVRARRPPCRPRDPAAGRNRQRPVHREAGNDATRRSRGRSGRALELRARLRHRRRGAARAPDPRGAGAALRGADEAPGRLALPSGRLHVRAGHLLRGSGAVGLLAPLGRAREERLSSSPRTACGRARRPFTYLLTCGNQGCSVGDELAQTGGRRPVCWVGSQGDLGRPGRLPPVTANGFLPPGRLQRFVLKGGSVWVTCSYPGLQPCPAV